jgi:hypothetical protein
MKISPARLSGRSVAARLSSRTVAAFVSSMALTLTATSAAAPTAGAIGQTPPIAVTAAIPAASTATATTLTVRAGPAGRRIPDGFLGLSIELPGFAAYAGSDPAAPNPILIQLIKNITPGQRPVLRLGGDSTDWSWIPVAGVTRPRGIRYTLTSDWVAVTRAVTNTLNARLILGVNLEADNTRLASGEASAFVSGLGPDHIDAVELGNEPELYDAFAWYRLPNGQKVLGRPKTWDYSAFASDFGRIAGALPRNIPLAAPSIGSPKWSPNLSAFLRSQPRTAVATLHRYPLKRCTASTHLTVGQLLSTSSTAGLADGVARYVTTAHSHHIPLRIDEMNSISCGGQDGLSDSYASALWAVDALYEMARVGVDGVNIHTGPNLTNELFYFHHIGSWRGAVRPIYYGLLMFAQAAPAGSQIQHVAGQIPAALRVWATKAADGTVRTVLINDGSAARTVRLKTTGTQSGAQATLEQLRAPGATALSGVTLGGQSFGLRTTTGLLEGRQNTPTLAPHGGFYTVTLPPWSAALVTVALP